jgi:hypothetical protein
LFSCPRISAWNCAGDTLPAFDGIEVENPADEEHDEESGQHAAIRLLQASAIQDKKCRF